MFADGTWGGTFHPDFEPLPGDVVAQEHWLSSGFANTDLDLQLKETAVRKLVVIGMRANTCIEPTVRFAAELGYEVTVVKDAIGSFGAPEMEASLRFNMPEYASVIVSTDEIVKKPAARRSRRSKTTDRIIAEPVAEATIHAPPDSTDPAHRVRDTSTTGGHGVQVDEALSGTVHHRCCTGRDRFDRFRAV
ncbi:cysteine hydrolase family protein [Streptomyces sp. NPDC059766]|uniref:cysteine hydrolase family protein n=1 Tax=Streptomyces sp. NPDC059766 TaxID=3346940 RepID=UPI003650B6E8